MLDLEVKISKLLEPSSLSRTQIRLSHEVLKGVVICLDLNGEGLAALKVGTPLA
jgi:hypothetical protein